MLLSRLVGSFSRQIWCNLPRYAARGSPAQSLLHRCLSSVSSTGGFMVPALTRPGWLGSWQQQAAGMKTRTALKRRCKDCFFVRRRGRLFVFCKTNPRHKQRQG